MDRDIAVRAAVFAAFVIAWLAAGGSAALLRPTGIVVVAGLALHAWVRRRTREGDKERLS
ncbi:hypothetical protein [Nonomuraea sp. NPDC049400]|uniref:hypothetical protein n=1 Tax=Nonomuraea sp. NPDC049400 TaxID=3364352 RepID=UPI0037B0DCA0